MESSLKELIFAQNSTTLQTLSDLELVDLPTVVLQINNLTTTVSNLSTQVAQFQTQLDSLGQTVFNNQASNNAKFNMIETDVTNLLEDVSTINTGLVTVTNDITNLNQSINTIDDSIGVITGDINTINTNIDNNTTSIVDIQDYIIVLNTKISDINTNISNLTTSITNIDDRLDVYDTNFNNINTQLADLDVDISGVTSQVSTLASNITTVGNDLNALSPKVILYAGVKYGFLTGSRKGSSTEYLSMKVLGPVAPVETGVKYDVELYFGGTITLNMEFYPEEFPNYPTLALYSKTVATQNNPGNLVNNDFQHATFLFDE